MMAVLTFTSTAARSIDSDQSLDSILLSQLANPQNTEQASRIKRQSYGSSDYYNNYYNNYYKKYYANQNQVSSNVRPPPPPAPIRSKPNAERYDSNQVDFSNDDYDRNDNQIQQPQQQIYDGQRYVYTPIFQYKSTHARKQEKLFVPNIFG